MKKQYLGTSMLSIAVGCTLLLAGCNGKKGTSVTDESMGAAVDQYLAKNGDTCLLLNDWPVEVSEHETRMEEKLPHGLARQMATLKMFGLVTETEGEVDQLIGKRPTGRKFKVRTFNLTEEGKKFYRPEVVPHAALAGSNPKVKGDLCYGKKAVEKVIKLDLLPESAPVEEYNVRYLYKIDGLPEWAKRPEFQQTFPGAARIISEAGKKQMTHGVKVTDSGLVPRGLHDI
jgi:hypothetical protein